MRKNLFRGKNILDGEWYYGSLLERVETDYSLSDPKAFKPKSIYTIQSLNGVTVTVDEKTIGQYIGRVDSNELTVFEGDIVKIEDTYLEDNPEFIGVVSFRDCSFMVRNAYSSNYRWMDFEVEILGNVYDDKDMVCEWDLEF